MLHKSGHVWEGPFRNNVENGVGIWKHPGERGRVEPGYRWIDGKPDKFVSTLEALEISSNMDLDEMLLKQTTGGPEVYEQLMKRGSVIHPVPTKIPKSHSLEVKNKNTS